MGRSQARLAFVRPACGHPSRPQPRPAPPTPTPAAGERRPGGRCGLGRERHKVSGRRERRAPGRGVHGGASRELVGGEWHRAPRGQAWTGGRALAGRVLGWAKRTCSLPPEGDSQAGASPPGTELSVAGSPGSRGSDPGTRTGTRSVAYLGRTETWGQTRSSSSREGPSERPCRLSSALPVFAFAFIPPSPLPTLCQIISSVTSRWFSRAPHGSGSTPRGRSAVRKRKQVGRRMTRHQELCVLGTSETNQSPGTSGALMGVAEAVMTLFWE